MPPKAAKAPKVNVEKRRAEYEKFISTRDEEFDLWKDLSVQKTFLKTIDTGTSDITENYEAFFDKMFQFATAFKMKMKQKEFRYEYFRSAFFGGVAIGGGLGTDLERNFDGLTRYVLKEHNDGAQKARRAFLEVYNALDDVNDLTEETFPEKKKKMKDALTAFVKMYEAHIKKHHKLIHEVMEEFLMPLKNVLVSNFHYSLFEYQNQDPLQRKLNNWKEQALLDKLCYDLQECFRILLMTEAIKDNPSLVIMTNKFHIKGWESNRIQKYFLQPLFETWINMRKEMSRLYVFGENHWVIPLKDNVDLVKLINELIQRELIAERILGNELKRDQLNFMFNTILYIFNTPVKEKLLSEGPEKEIVTEHVIPKLTILRYLDHIVRITKAKREDVHKQGRREEFLAIYRSNQNNGTQGAHEEEKKDSVVESPDILLKRDTKTPFISAVDEEDTPEDLERFGRYWVWSDYLPENLKEEILNGAEMLRNINVAVRQDLADDYVNVALKVPTNLHRGGAEILKKKKEKVESVNPADKVRPPYVWNHTDIVELPHDYRANARPYDIYLDSRVKNMNNQIEFLAAELRNYLPERWKELVKEVIGFFRTHADEKHTEIVNVKLPQTF